MLIFEFLSDTVSIELGLLETIGFFVICLSKKVLIFTEIVPITINWGCLANWIHSHEIFKEGNFAKINSREILGSAQFAKINSRKILSKVKFAKINFCEMSKKNSQKLIPAKMSSLKVANLGKAKDPII